MLLPQSSCWSLEDVDHGKNVVACCSRTGSLVLGYRAGTGEEKESGILQAALQMWLG